MTGKQMHRFFLPFERHQIILMPRGSVVLMMIERAMEWQLHVAIPDDPGAEWIAHELRCFRPEDYVGDYDTWQYAGAVKEPLGPNWWHAFIRVVAANQGGES